MSVENVFHADIIPQMQSGCMARSGGAVARTPTVGVSNSDFQAALSTKNSEEPLMCTRSGILRRVFPVAIARRELTINQDQRALTLWLPEMIEYVYLALKSLESIILSDYKKSGTTVESIIWNKFVDLPIPLPPLNEQKRIVKRVEELKATTRTLVTF
ncbi:MAG: restriction endonuclease subunit S [Kiritimatiellae bacterium]|nr:restriction endonuclease subunit S [Kiritimatiellia bacterium]